MKGGRALGTNQANHIQGVPVVEAPAPKLDKPMSELLAERGLLDDSPAAGSETVEFHREISAGPKVLEGEFLAADEYVTHLDVNLIDRSPYQPRRIFNEAQLQRLAEAIQANGGLNNPVIVRRKSNGRFELVAGERRWRAHEILEWKLIKAHIRDLSDEDAAVLAVTDNEAQEPLTDFERALSYKKLLDSKAVKTQVVLARRVGRSVATISRCLAYFKLPDEIIALLEDDPVFIGTKHVADLAALADDGHKELVIEAAKHVYDGKLSQEAAVGWIKASIKKSSEQRQPTAPSLRLSTNGRPVAEVKVRGQKITLDCPKGVNPDEVLEIIKKHFDSPKGGAE